MPTALAERAIQVSLRIVLQERTCQPHSSTLRCRAVGVVFPCFLQLALYRRWQLLRGCHERLSIWYRSRGLLRCLPLLLLLLCLQIRSRVLVPRPPRPGMAGPRELAADGRHGDMEIELLLQELLDIFQLEIVVLLEEGDDSLQTAAALFVSLQQSRKGGVPDHETAAAEGEGEVGGGGSQQEAAG